MEPLPHRDRACSVARSFWFQSGWVALGIFFVALPLIAQNLLLAENGGKAERVRSAEGNSTFLLGGGKLVSREAGHFILKSTAEYLPVKIAVLDQRFQKGARAISDDGVARAQLVQAGRFVFTANLKATRSLDHVILALVLESKEIGNSIYLKGIDHLNAHQINHVSIDETTPLRLLGVRLAGVHLFIDGKEAFNSTLPESKWANALDRMVAKRVAAVHEAALKPLYVSDPVYPAALKNKIAGQVIVACQVDVQGKIVNPSVKSETNPDFGAAALEAVREWRFVPQVKEGHAIEAAAEIAVDFPAP